MLVFEVFLLSMMVVLLLNDDDDPNEGYPAKLENYPIVLKLTGTVQYYTAHMHPCTSYIHISSLTINKRIQLLVCCRVLLLLLCEAGTPRFFC